MTRYGVPSSVVPPSSRRAMLGCSRLARICRSFSEARQNNTGIVPGADNFQSDFFAY